MKAHPVQTPKLADVARLAGVGNGTVSRVLNGGRNVSTDKTARINAAMRQLNYRPNRVARSLKGAHSGIFGMIVPSISDMFFSRCAEAVEGIVREHGDLLVVVASHDDDELLLAGLRQLLLHKTDGLVLAHSKPHSPELIATLRDIRIPVVGIDGPLSDVGLPSVLCENHEGARMATEHLLSHGYKTILSVQVKPTLYTMKERLRGYRAALRGTGVPAIQEVIFDRESAMRLLRTHVNGREPVALFASNNLTARYICEAVHDLGLSIPDQVAILSFDDFDLADSLSPPMSVVQQPLDDIGRCAARLLFERRNGHIPATDEPGKPLLLMPQLVLRESCGCSPRSQAEPSARETIAATHPPPLAATGLPG